MYENGRKVNHYAAKMIHKKRQKNLSRRKWAGGFACSSWEDYVAHVHQYWSLDYWKTHYFSGPKKYAKDQTNSILRAKFRRENANADYESMYAPQHSEYQKYFDYAWSVW